MTDHWAHTHLPTWTAAAAAAAAAAAKSLQSCLTLCDPINGSPPGSPVPGILQARTLSGLPFPSPMHESEKWKWSRSVVSDSSRPHGLQPTRLLRPWDFPGKNAGLGCHCFLQCGIYNQILLSIKKEQCNVTCSNMSGLMHHHTEWSQRKTIPYNITSMWNLEKNFTDDLIYKTEIES